MMERDRNTNGTFETTERVTYLADGLGSIVALTGSSGQVLERYRYDSFGTPTILGPGPDSQMDTADDTPIACSAYGNPFLFTGREYDCESGLIYMRARYYDSATGRFLQEDPLQLFGGINVYTYVGSVGKPLPYVKPPNETNLYLYTGNNPITRIDPLGLWYIDVNIGVGWWGAVGTGGIIFSDKGVYSYGGGGGGTPGPAFALTWSPFDPTPGWNFGLQGGVWAGGQVGTDIAGNPFWEVGFVTPGASATGYFVEPFQWPWQKDTKQACSEKKK